jgi:hypothetical protein
MSEAQSIPEVTESQLQDIRETLVNDGLQGAATAPAANVLKKMEGRWPGGVQGFIRDNY